jgi:hypothetical protein
MSDHWEHLTRYLEDGRLEIDNNGVENAISQVACFCVSFVGESCCMKSPSFLEGDSAEESSGEQDGVHAPLTL